MNTIGNILRLSVFGESHGPAIGGIIDGLPPRMTLDDTLIAEYMARRRPGASPLTSARQESDIPKIISGLSPDRLTLGTPLAFVIENSDVRSRDYEELRHVWRPNHADYTYDAKYGIRDHRGGGHASGRLTAPMVFAGAIAASLLKTRSVDVRAEVIQAGGDSDIEDAVARARADLDSVGAVVECRLSGMPPGVGSPLFGKLQARLAAAMLSIGGCKGFEYGDGFAAARSRGSEQVDHFIAVDGRPRTTTNHSGGIQGGISTGEEIVFRVAFKPTPTLPGRALSTLDDSLNPIQFTAAGRHDPCIGLRAAVVVEALAAFVAADEMLCSGFSFPLR